VGYLDRATNKLLSSGKSTFGQVRIYIIFVFRIVRRKKQHKTQTTPTLYQIIEQSRRNGGKRSEGNNNNNNNKSSTNVLYIATFFLIESTSLFMEHRDYLRNKDISVLG